jgi:hypothetical protein
MKRTSRAMRGILGLLIAPIVCTASVTAVRADIINGTNGPGLFFFRYSDTGTPLNNQANAPQVPGEEFLDCMTVDGTGKIFGVGSFLSTYEPFSLSGTTLVKSTPTQLKEATDIEFVWDHRLLITSHILSGNGLTGVLEFNPSTMTFIQNFIPISAAYLGFSPQETNPAGLRTGTLYVGNDSGTTERYRLTTGGTLTKDTLFSISKIGNTHFRAGDNTIYMEDGIGGNSILRFDPTTGASLGTFLTLPGGTISDFAFGNDNSVYVLGNIGPSFGVYHYAPDGTRLCLKTRFSRFVGS